MVLGIDIDDTLTKTTENIQRFLDEFDKSAKNYHKLSPEKYEEFLYLYIEKIMATNPLKENAKECLDKLHNMGHKIILITARNNFCSPNVKDITLKYLKEQEIYYDKIIFDDAVTGYKGSVAKKEHVDLFIDDKEEVLDEIATYGIKVLRFTSEKSKYPTFTDWNKVVEYIERL